MDLQLFERIIAQLAGRDDALLVLGGFGDRFRLERIFSGYSR